MCSAVLFEKTSPELVHQGCPRAPESALDDLPIVLVDSVSILEGPSSFKYCACQQKTSFLELIPRATGAHHSLIGAGSV